MGKIGEEIDLDLVLQGKKGRCVTGISFTALADVNVGSEDSEVFLVLRESEDTAEERYKPRFCTDQ